MSSGAKNLQLVEGDFLDYPLEPASYDFVSFLASLHHMPFAIAVGHAKTLLRPGGVLGILGLWRDQGIMDFLASAIAFPMSRWYRLTRRTPDLRQPIVDPTMTLAQIRTEAASLLPGAQLRRHLLWRYTLIWRKPGATPSPR